MRVGIDLHGVLNDKPEAFKPMLKALKANGDEIYVISGPPMEKIVKELEELGYTSEHFDHVVSVVDYLKAEGVKMWQDFKNDWWAESDDWWSSKGKICEKYNIGVLFDNSVEYEYFMPYGTSFVLIDDKR